ncbi:hypothetical protein [uncultured Nitratireductor sp.]|uniref:hypothetical protein n=1 Tax=uncultured Nitratireductor sp. TaxID=520953 RepID=UPI0025EF9703|nr:hypothetical protein [uncultured Nitratireductor sp.]
MRDLGLQASGALAIFIAVMHGAIAELRIFAKVRIEPRGSSVLLRMVWQASTVSWIAIGVLLIATPSFGSQSARQWIIAIAIFVYGYAALGNAIATRGRHIGWMLMSTVVMLAMAGI